MYTITTNGRRFDIRFNDSIIETWDTWAAASARIGVLRAGPPPETLAQKLEKYYDEWEQILPPDARDALLQLMLTEPNLAEKVALYEAILKQNGLLHHDSPE